MHRSLADTEIKVKLEEAVERLLPEIVAQQLGRVLCGLGNQMAANSTESYMLARPGPEPSLRDVYERNGRLQQSKAQDNDSTRKDGVPPTNGYQQTHQDTTTSSKETIHRSLSETTYLTSLEDEDKNLFDIGLDSIQVAAFVKHVNPALGYSDATHRLIEAKEVYENPTINKLARLIEQDS